MKEIMRQIISLLILVFLLCWGVITDFVLVYISDRLFWGQSFLSSAFFLCSDNFDDSIYQQNLQMKIGRIHRVEIFLGENIRFTLFQEFFVTVQGSRFFIIRSSSLSYTGFIIRMPESDPITFLFMCSLILSSRFRPSSSLA